MPLVDGTTAPVWCDDDDACIDVSLSGLSYPSFPCLPQWRILSVHTHRATYRRTAKRLFPLSLMYT
jgi:hypothetical protein